MSTELPQVVPMPTYEDVGRASAWLCEAFGFREQTRFSDKDGRVTRRRDHARLDGSELPEPAPPPRPVRRGPQVARSALHRRRRAGERGQRRRALPARTRGGRGGAQRTRRHAAGTPIQGRGRRGPPLDVHAAGLNYRTRDTENTVVLRHRATTVGAKLTPTQRTEGTRMVNTGTMTVSQMVADAKARVENL